VRSQLFCRKPAWVAKQARGMPPWFLGALFSSLSCGLILTWLLLGWLSKKIYTDLLVVLGLVTIGISILLLPWAPGAILPLVVMFSIGAGMASCSVTINTQNAIALAALPLFLVPRFLEFYRLPPKRAAVFFKENYPDAFQ